MKIALGALDKRLCSGPANGNSGVGKSQEIGIFKLPLHSVLTRAMAVE